MKKIIFTAAILFFSFFIVSKMFAQCTPVPGNTALITPDTITNFVSGTDGIPYTQVVLVHPPYDTTVLYNGNTVTVVITHIQLNSISGLPPGLSFACNPSSCDFVGNASGCLLISGTPTTAGNYPLTVIITTYATLLGFPLPSQIDTLHSYHILINVNAGINTLNNSNFQMIASGADPVTEHFTFKMNAPLPANAELTINNIIGQKVYADRRKLNKGINSIDINTKNISPGLYILSLKSGTYSLTERFVVVNK